MGERLRESQVAGRNVEEVCVASFGGYRSAVRATTEVLLLRVPEQELWYNVAAPRSWLVQPGPWGGDGKDKEEKGVKEGQEAEAEEEELLIIRKSARVENP